MDENVFECNEWVIWRGYWSFGYFIVYLCDYRDNLFAKYSSTTIVLVFELIFSKKILSVHKNNFKFDIKKKYYYCNL